MARKIRLIDDTGTMLGVFQTSDAVKMAQEKGLDLIEVAPDADPPTCKILDYGKYKYELKKKKQGARKKQTQVAIKELQLRPRTGQHDIDTKLRHARRFLIDGDKVRFNLRFRGREMAHLKQGEAVLYKVIDALNDIAILETPPKMEGRQIFALLSPDGGKIKIHLKEEAKKVQKPVE